MRLRRSSSLTASLLSGALLCLSFPRFSIFPLAWIALVPHLHFILRIPSWRRLLAGHFLLSLVYFGGTLYWIPRVLTTYGHLSTAAAAGVFLLMVLVMGLFLLPFSWLTRWVAARSPALALWAAPGFWLLTEFLRNYYMVGGFPWALLGYSQYPFQWLIQIADLSGVYLLSFLIVLGNCALARISHTQSTAEPESSTLTALPGLGLLEVVHDYGSGGLGRNAFSARRFRLLATTGWEKFGLVGLVELKKRRLAVVFGTLFLAANLYGVYRVHFWEIPSTTPLKVSLVQANIALSGSREYYAKMYFKSLPAYYQKAAQEGAEWVIFAEAQNPFLFRADLPFTTFWQNQAREAGVGLLLNGSRLEAGSERYFNSAFLIDGRGETAYRYDKIHLVPFGEYLPYGRILGFAGPLVQEVGGFSPGLQTVQPGRVKTTRFATLICYESIFPQLSRQFVRAGAMVLVNMTNDSWFGPTAAPEQHLQMATFRAVENRKPLLRCANSGYSAFISPLGRVRRRLGLFEEGMLTQQVAGNRYRSLYSRIGDGFNLSLIMGTMLWSVVNALGWRREGE
ncbi:MAG: apolipoprotein N-acyltransferase [Acidobacteriota bacterium]